MKSLSKTTLVGCAKLVVSIALIGYLLSKVDLNVIIEKLEMIHWIPLFLAFLIGHLDRILMALKWWLLVQTSGLNVTPMAAVTNTYMGSFAGQFLPSGIGADVVRILLFRKMSVPTLEVTSSIVIERVLGMLALVVTAGLSILLCRVLGFSILRQLELAVLCISGLLFFIILISFVPWHKLITKRLVLLAEKSFVFRKMGEFVEGYQRYSKYKIVLTMFFFLSIVEVLVVIVIIRLICEALVIEIGFVQLVMAMPVILLISKLPISINGIGVNEGLFGYYFVIMGESLENAILLSIIIRLIDIVVLAPGGFLYFYTKSAETNRVAA